MTNVKISNQADVKRSKGETDNSNQKGASGISKKGKEKHKKDDSDGAAKNTTKKQANSI